jgi:hypothetical protein
MNLTNALETLIDAARQLPENRQLNQAIKRVEQKLEALKAKKARSKISFREPFSSLQAANIALPQCPRPLANSDGNHWWYLDTETIDADLEKSMGVLESIACKCKSCPARVRVSVDAEDLPEL